MIRKNVEIYIPGYSGGIIFAFPFTCKHER